ncbi:hypothetical protein D0T85_22160 [Bacteroides sp. 519]|nr:hypothetical protein [Bacteroides sp. 519]
MRPILCLLLVILAVCCYEANAAIVCEAVKRESATFILKSEEALKKELEQYNAPPEAVEAKLKVKRCIDRELSYPNKVGISTILGQILAYCLKE